MRRLLLAGVLLAVAGGAPAAAGPATTPGALRAQIADAAADEERAWRALATSQPRWETATLRLGRSLTRLREIRAQLDDPTARSALDEAIAKDIRAIAALNARDAEQARRLVQVALYFKSVSAFWLTQPRAAAPSAAQCADGKDNDGDGLRDSVHDSGCSSPADRSERSAATCEARFAASGRSGTLSGSCAGPFARVVVDLPSGSGFDTARPPTADGAVGCRYASARRLECVLRDGARNRRHRIRIRFGLEGRAQAPSKLRVLDFGGRPLAVAVAAPPAPPPRSTFQLAAFATYAHGTASSNVCVFVWTVPGQPPLRGGVTLTGPAGEETKAFTTLGGDAKTRIVFTVTERARYVADVTLAGKAAQAAASLGLAPTTSGELACPVP